MMKTFVGNLKALLKRMMGIHPQAPLFLLRQQPENMIGTLQTEEAIFLYGLVRVLQPELVVEFGFLNGYSATIILSAMSGRGQLHSYDVSEYAKDSAKEFKKKASGFFYHHKSQTDFEGRDVQNKGIEFVLMDAAHDLQMNIATFQKLKPFLTDEALVMVHDTGLWHRKHMTKKEFNALPKLGYKWLDEERLAHQIEERRFINWIIEHEDEWTTVSFGSSASLRHGFTLLGRKRLLEV